jgi:hypothetical protein
MEAVPPPLTLIGSAATHAAQQLPQQQRVQPAAVASFAMRWCVPRFRLLPCPALQVCREAYPPVVCYLLWVLAEISIVALDLTMVLGEGRGPGGGGMGEWA